MDPTIGSITDCVDLRHVTLDISSRQSPGYKLSSYQDAECSLYSESCWHNFDPDVRAICERI